LAIIILNKLSAGQFDIETAFLYGNLVEELWMELPEGYSSFRKEKYKDEIDRTKHCLRLTKAIYGLVQAA
jgi:hypothetical protein